MDASFLPRCERCGHPKASVGTHCGHCLGLVSLDFQSAAAGGADEPTEDLPRAFGEYVLEARLGQGGMGVVYRARDWKLNRTVAIKMLLGGQFASGDALRRFRTEAEAAAKLRHPNIITLYEVGEVEGIAYFSMEYIEGRNLAEVVQKESVPFTTCARWMRGIADAVEHAHSQGILHRDLKPSNILIDPFGEPRVTDFGLARHSGTDSNMTLTGQALGSPGYMPPEQARGEHRNAGPTSDVYGLGAVLYHLLTGRPPYLADSVAAILSQIENSEPIAPRRLNPSIPIDLQTLALKCLEKEPSRRLPTAKSLREELDRFLAQEPIHSRAVSPAERVWRWCLRRPAIASLAAALVLALVFGSLGIFIQWRRAEHQKSQAVASASIARRNEYAADIKAASDAWQRGDLAEARRWLNRHQPSPGTEDLRGFEWYFLRSLAKGLESAELVQHTSTVSSVTLSPDGRWLASGSLDQTLALWNAQTLQPIKQRFLGGPGWFAEFTPDSRLLLSAATPGVVELMSIPELKVIRSFPGQLGSIATEVPLAALSEGSPWFWEPDGAVSVWNYLTGEREQTLPIKGHAVAISPDGRWVAVGIHPNRVTLWDRVNRGIFAELTTHQHPWCLKFSPDSRLLAVTANDKRIQLWDLAKVQADAPPLAPGVTATGRLTVTETPARADALLEEGHSLRVWSVAFSPDGKALLSTSSDRSIRLWSLPDLRPTAVWQGHHDEIWCSAFMPSGKRFVTGGKDSRVMVWDQQEPTSSPAQESDLGFPPSFTPSGKELLTHHHEGQQTAKTFTPVEGGKPRSFTDYFVYSGFNAEGTKLISNPSEEGTVIVRSLSTLESEGVIKLEGYQEGVPVEFHSQGVSADGTICYAVQTNGVLSLWHLPDGKLVRRVATRTGPRFRGVMSRDNRWFAISYTFPYDVFLYDLRSGKERILSGHTEYVKGLQFSPDSRQLATAGVDGKIRLWRSQDGSLVQTLTGHLQEASDVAYSPDGQTLASVEGYTSLKLWRLDTYREVASMAGRQFGWHLAFSSDGQSLVVDRTDGKAEVFRAVVSGQESGPPIQ